MNQKTEEWLAQVGKNLSDRDKQLTERAAETIEGNIWTDAVWYPYSCIAPFRSGKDSALWGWDSAFHAITVSRWDTQLASECLEGFMNYQLPSGAFPDVVSAQGTVETRCSKPPLLAHACEAVYRKTGDKFFLKRAYMRLLQNERYLCENRKYGGMFYYDATDRNDPEYYIWARNDTGLDNSVRWDDYCAEYWPIDLNCFAVMMYRSLRFMAEELRDAERLNEWEQKEQELTRLIKKYKITVRMDGKTEQEIRETMDDAHVKSVNAFIIKAIKFYLGYLKQGKNLNFVSPILASAVKSEMNNIEQNLSEIIFKMAVQISMLAQVVADEKEFRPEYLEELYRWCAEKVASTNGIIFLEDMHSRENIYTEYDYLSTSGDDY